jgi:hypothetical protein
MLASLENSPFSAWVRESLWGWPVALTIHVLGTALVIGFVLIIALRMLGLFETIPYASLSRLFPVIWVAFAIECLSGVVLWLTKPTRYVADTAFALKITFVIIGFGLLVSFYRLLKHQAAAWDAGGAPGVIRFVIPTVLVWCGVLVAARLTAHLGALPVG